MRIICSDKNMTDKVIDQFKALESDKHQKRDLLEREVEYVVKIVLAKYTTIEPESLSIDEKPTTGYSEVDCDRPYRVGEKEPTTAINIETRNKQIAKVQNRILNMEREMDELYKELELLKS